MITKPMLPPKKGYVEVEANGVRTYRNIETGLLIDSEHPSPATQRESAYNNDPIIEWEGEHITVTQAAQKWQYYAAEGSDKANTLTDLIARAKQTIREQYPDDGYV